MFRKSLVKTCRTTTVQQKHEAGVFYMLYCCKRLRRTVVTLHAEIKKDGRVMN